MRVAPVYVVCAALIVAVRAEKSFLVFNGNEPPEGGEAVQRDYPTINFDLLLPRLLYAKAREQQQEQQQQQLQRLDSINNMRQWFNPFNPYNNNAEINEIDGQLYQDERVKKHQRPSLSISNPLDVLRNHMINTLSKNARIKSVTQNRDHLSMIGKRVPSAEDYEKMYLKND